MSTKTTNLELIKLELTDVADITSFNTNWDKIDGELKDLKDNTPDAYNLPTAGQNKLGGVKTTSTITSNSGHTACPIISGVPYYKNTTYSAATQSSNGLMSSSDKTKLDGIATGAEVNQNAFSNVKVGNTTISADSKTDTLEIVAGSNVTITTEATNDKVTIAAKDTTYGTATQSASGLMSSNDKTKLDGMGYTYGTTDLTAGTSQLETGKLYFVYE